MTIKRFQPNNTNYLKQDYSRKTLLTNLKSKLTKRKKKQYNVLYTKPEKNEKNENNNIQNENETLD